MWQVTLVMALALAGPDGAADSLDEIESRIVPEAELRAEDYAGRDLGVSRGVTPWGIEFRSTLRGGRVGGSDAFRYGSVAVGRSWRSHPDSTTSLRAALRGPVVALGVKPSIAAGFRRGTRTVTVQGVKRRETTWTPSPTLELAGSRAGLALRFTDPVAKGEPFQLRGWSARIGDTAAAMGGWSVSRTRSATPATSFTWRRRGGGVWTLTGRLTGRVGRLRFARTRARHGFDVSVRASPPPKSSTQPRTRAAETGRIRAVVTGPRWQAGALYAAGFKSRGLESFGSRTFHVPGGSLATRATIVRGSTREARWHASYAPRARLGPLRFSFGAGVAVRRLTTRTRVKPELSGAVMFRPRGFSARLGWEFQPVAGTLRVTPGASAHVIVRRGPVTADIRYRPGSAGFSGSASAAWGR